MFSKQTVALAAAISSASAAIYQGFNYDASVDFESEFALAKSLAGTNGAFASARLYTSIAPNTANSPIGAFQAAIDQDVTLLLGLWGSSGAGTIQNEITAIQTAISTLGSAFTSRVVGISVGSEDLYRISPTGVINKSGVGAEPADIVNYVNMVRSALAGTALSSVPIGHVDTWTAWVNGSNSAVVEAVDFLGVDAYPYFQSTQQNDIGSAPDLFFSAYDQTVAAASGKPVWVTETGWPASGPNSGAAVPSTANAESYWQAVACKLLGATNTWWYTLNDAGASPSFGVTTGSSTPLYDLSCSASSSSSSSSSAAPSTSSSSAAASASKSSVAASTTSAAASSSAAASTSAHESTASPSNSVVSVSSSAVASQAGGGSPGDSSVAAQFSSTGAFSAALTSASATASASASASASGSAKSSAAGSSAAATTVSTVTSGSASKTAAATTASVSPYQGAASIATAGSTGAIVAAIMALFAL